MTRSRQSRRSPALRDLGIRKRIGGVVVCLVLSLLCAGAVQAIDDHSNAEKSQMRAGRAGLSLIDIDLPLDFIARFGGAYSRYRYAIDALAYDRWLAPGPAIRRDSLIESRVSLGRQIAKGFEFEVAWATQSQLSFSSMPLPDRQTVGAYFRFTH